MSGVGTASAETLLERVRALVLAGTADRAYALAREAAAARPDSVELALALAGLALENGERAVGETALRGILAGDPRHVAAAFLLARSLLEHGCTRAAAGVLAACLDGPEADREDILEAVELLDRYGRQGEALQLVLGPLARGDDDPRLRMHAAALHAQLGQFDAARPQYERLVEQAPEAALKWHVPVGLAELQRYPADGHADVERFERWLERTAEPEARIPLLFALGKAYDDMGDYRRAAERLREANALVARRAGWSRKLYRRAVAARLARPAPAPLPPPARDWSPLFIVGAPRSGSTLLATRLARHPAVRNRGELPWMPTFATALHADPDPGTMQRQADRYARLLRQDDPADAAVRWFVDKQMHNFMDVDLILALFPDARVLHCLREPRDNAISLWQQIFRAGTQDFAYDMADIAAFLQGSARLARHWQARYPGQVRLIRYEDLVQDAEATLAATRDWLGLAPPVGTTAPGGEAIATASLWQARQPVHHRSVGRWQRYAEFIPQLAGLGA